MKTTDIAVMQEQQLFQQLITVGVGILLLSVTVNYFDSYLKSKVSISIRNDLRTMTFHHLLRLPSSSYDNSHSGELVSHLTSDNQAIGQALGNTLMMLIRSPMMAFFSFLYLLNIYWPLAVICGFIGPLNLLVGKVFGKAIRENSKRVQELIAKSTGFLQDVLSGSTVVKTFALERNFYGKYQNFSQQILLREMKGGKISATMQATSNGIGVLSFIVAFVLGAYFVINEKMTIGGLIAFIQLLNHVTWPFTGLAGLWGNMQHALGAADRIFEGLKKTVEYATFPNENKRKQTFTNLELRNVGFAYGNKEVIHHLDLKVESGKTVAIVGPSGAGKTTLFKLLLGLYKPTQGSIIINGRNTGLMELDELRSYFSIVPQETYLFAGSVRDNIADGKPNATMEEITRAAKFANAYEFITGLPEGFATEVGERGMKLSGGQKQRIAISRALLRDAPVLLLDEATAALDNESEKLIQDAMDNLIEGRTSFVIAHRLSTVQRADSIIVMDQGRIVESGTHEELLSYNGLYRRLFNLQFGMDPESHILSHLE